MIQKYIIYDKTKGVSLFENVEESRVKSLLAYLSEEAKRNNRVADYQSKPHVYQQITWDDNGRTAHPEGVEVYKTSHLCRVTQLPFITSDRLNDGVYLEVRYIDGTTSCFVPKDINHK